jgi:hypothetical protein
VNTASRAQSAAAAGEILMTQAVYERAIRTERGPGSGIPAKGVQHADQTLGGLKIGLNSRRESRIRLRAKMVQRIFRPPARFGGASRVDLRNEPRAARFASASDSIDEEPSCRGLRIRRLQAL